MSTQPFQATPIDSYSPSTDTRNDISNSRRVQQPTVALDGKNFYFDSLGPKSGFSASLLGYDKLSAPHDVQSVSAGGRVITFTQDCIVTLGSPHAPHWLFAEPVPFLYRSAWSGIELDGAWYYVNDYRGMFKAVDEANPAAGQNATQMRFSEHNALTIPGVIDKPSVIMVVLGRPILVNAKTIQWGAVGNIDDFTPALAGAGIQVISALIPGEVVGATAFESSFVVWTTEGSVTVEHIGGDATWRFVVNRTEERPINSWSYVRLSEGTVAFLSPRGLKTLGAQGAYQDWTQEFNEFLREYISSDVRHAHKWKLAYDKTRELLFVSDSRHNKVYALSTTLGKWGLFSHKHFGLLEVAEGLFGYVDGIGQVYYFDGKKAIERAPSNELGLSRQRVSSQKLLEIPSSSLVSNTHGKGDELALALPAYGAEGWYEVNATMPSPRALGSLDAEILIGYLRPQGSSMSADGLLEMQELVMGTPPRKAPEPMDFTTVWNADHFYPESEDWGSGAVEPDEDWGSTPDETINWNGAASSNPPNTFSLSLEASEDGITFVNVVPAMVKFNTKASLYTMITSGTFHRLKVTADKQGDYWHLSYVGFTMVYGGENV